MSWASAVKDTRALASKVFRRPTFEQAVIDWDRLVVIDFETFFSDEYTLRKLSTSEYIRDPRFKAQMMGLKVGKQPTRAIKPGRMKAELAKIPWSTHSLLCHHTHFDGFILAEHFKVQPRKLYCSLSMARALHNSDIGAGLDEVSVHYGGKGKLHDILEQTKGVLNWWSPELFKKVTPYCINDTDECLRVFKAMLPAMPADEIDLIDLTVRCFTDPVLKVDLERVQVELEREIEEKRQLLLGIAGTKSERVAAVLTMKKTKKELASGDSDEDILIARTKTQIGSNDKFAALLLLEGVDAPEKISPTWMKKPVADRDEDKKWTYAFAKTDVEFTALKEHPKKRVRDLVEARLSVKSSSNETRAGRLLESGKDGAYLPVYYKYAAALSLRWGGGDKRNFQNMKRGGELRKSILADDGHVICVADSGQIECRVNGWLWGQKDLMDGFRKQDAGSGFDVYADFASTVYGRPIDKKKDPEERFVGKTSILGLGYQMGPPRLQVTLAMGKDGPPVYLDINVCQKIVNLYRRKNFRIKEGWAKCQSIIEDMAAGCTGAWGPICWEKEKLWLPNGMCLKYPGLYNKSLRARVANRLVGQDDTQEEQYDEWVYSRKGDEAKIYGGLLCENIVQALARIIVGCQMLKISRFARVVLTTHDEVGTHVIKRRGPKVFDDMVKVMRTPLPWCMDLPLNAEGGFDVCYSK